MANIITIYTKKNGQTNKYIKEEGLKIENKAESVICLRFGAFRWFLLDAIFYP